MARTPMMLALAGLLACGCGGDGATFAATAQPTADRIEAGAGSAAMTDLVSGTAGSDASAAVAAPVPAAAQETSLSPLAGADPADPSAPRPVSPEPVREVLPVTPAPPASPAYAGPRSPELQVVVESALADAARRSGMNVGELVVIRAESVVWPDGSLGCPEPGMSYTMALVPGYRVLIGAADKVLDYHASRRGYVVYCPPARSVEPLPSASS